MRLFYAIELSEETRQNIRDRISQLKSAGFRGRFSRVENLHLTLQFLGECPDVWLDDLCLILDNAVRNIPRFTLKIGNMGTFGRHHDILWLGVDKNPRLHTLVQSISAGLQEKMLPHEKNLFHPHITIGRQVHFAAGELDNFTWPPITEPVGHISLMRSSNYEGRLIYTAIYRQYLTARREKKS